MSAYAASGVMAGGYAPGPGDPYVPPVFDGDDGGVPWHFPERKKFLQDVDLLAESRSPQKPTPETKKHKVRDLHRFAVLIATFKDK